MHDHSMFIRRTSVKNRTAGGSYYTYRLVENKRIDGKVKQYTLINLGRHFDVPKSEWKSLSARIKQLLEAQIDLIDNELHTALESKAQYYAARIIAAGSEETKAITAYHSVDLDSMELVRPRRVGVEHLALHAIKQLKLQQKLQELKFNRHQLAAALGNIVARMAFPASERATRQWLGERSGLGELVHYHYEEMAPERLYQASDLLWKHRDALQKHLYSQERSLFGFEETITLYDLTNTFFEGTAARNPKAQYGRSKEKRTDCPLVTLGLVLDSSGFPRYSDIFSGNATESETLQAMLSGLNAKAGALVVLDAGIATEENICWLLDNGYRYLVVSRKRKREFDINEAITVKETPGQQVKIQRIINKDTGEVELYCHSERREKKEQAIQDRFARRFEKALQTLADGLHKKGTIKRYDKVLERIGRLKEKYARVAQHYAIKVIPDPDSDKAKAVHFKRKEKPHTQATHPGVYCLRTCVEDWDEETLWKTYTMLTDLEAVFRSLKSELGMRPIYHHKEERVSGHIFITLLAYHLVHTLRTQLKTQGIHDSWQSLRRTMENQQRVTVMLQCEDGKTVHLRKTTRAEPGQKKIYDALGVITQPGGSQKTFIG